MNKCKKIIVIILATVIGVVLTYIILNGVACYYDNVRDEMIRESKEEAKGLTNIKQNNSSVNDIINKVHEQTNKAEAKEKILIAVIESTIDGKLNYDKLVNELNNIDNILGVPNIITDSSWPLEVSIDKYTFEITADGTVTEKELR